MIGIGGGSAIDAGKAIAALLTNPGDLLDYLEVVGQGRAAHQCRRLPFIAIPTTAGTGAEVTRNAVLGSAGARREGQPAQPAHAAAPGAWSIRS